MSTPLSGSQKRELKSRAQRLQEKVRLGHAGVSEGFLAALNDELARNELVKVRFADFKEQRHELAPEIAEKSGSLLIQLVGNVAVYFRAKPKAEPSEKATGGLPAGWDDSDTEE